MAKRLTAAFLAAWLGCQVSWAAADEVLPDPTRPPPEATLVAGPAASGPVLQSVMIAPGHRSAMIGGRLLKEGDTFGDAKLVKILPGEVILSGPSGEETLKVFPSVEKTPTRQPRAEAPEAAPRQDGPKQKRNTERKVP